MRNKRILLIFFIFFNIETIKLPILQSLKKINTIEELKCSKFIEFKEEYEELFLRKTPQGITEKIINDIGYIHGSFINFLDKERLFFDYPGKAYVAVLKNAFIAPSKEGTTFDTSQQIILNWGSRYPQNYALYPDIDEADLNLPIVQNKKIATLCQKYANSYYHWLAETLPRLTLLLNFIEKDKEIKLLINSNTPHYIWKYLSLLGITKDRCIIANKKFLYYADEIFFALPTHFGNPSIQGISRVCNILKSKIEENNKEEPKNTKSKIIIIKRIDTSRQIENFEDMLAKIYKKFSAYKKEIIIFDGTLDALQTIILFNNAKLIIGVHGAGLTNMIFSLPGINVIEFMPKNSINLCFWHLACTKKINHWFILVPETTKASKYLKCPIKELISIMKKIL